MSKHRLVQAPLPGATTIFWDIGFFRRRRKNFIFGHFFPIFCLWRVIFFVLGIFCHSITCNLCKIQCGIHLIIPLWRRRRRIFFRPKVDRSTGLSKHHYPVLRPLFRTSVVLGQGGGVPSSLCSSPISIEQTCQFFCAVPPLRCCTLQHYFVATPNSWPP